MKPTQPRFEVIGQHGHHSLRLSLPPGSSALNDISCNNEYGFDVPDAVIDINLDKLMKGLAIMMQHPDVFRHVGIEASVQSAGYEGKLRQEYLKVYANYVVGNWHFSFFLKFCNEWSESVYFMDMADYVKALLGSFDDIVDALRQLITDAP